MPAVLVGFLIDCLLGDPAALPHPIVLIGKGIAALEKAQAALQAKGSRQIQYRCLNGLHNARMHADT